jgi:hypothetical protein
MGNDGQVVLAQSAQVLRDAPASIAAGGPGG